MNKLVQAIWAGDPGEIDNQMSKPGVNYRANKDQALIAAARMGNSALVRVLIDNGCEPASQSHAALRAAVQSGDLATVRAVIGRGEPCDREARTPIMVLAVEMAEKNKHFDPMIIEMLLCHEFGRNARFPEDFPRCDEPFRLAIQLGLKRVFGIFLEHGYGLDDQYRSALKHAVLHERLELCQELISMGADFDSIGDALLQTSSALTSETGRKVHALIKRNIVTPPKRKRAELEAALCAWKPEGVSTF